MEDYVVQDGPQEIRFTGEQLAHASSYTPAKPRWIELTLYRTRAGTYVLQGVGQTTLDGEVTRVFAHVSDEPRGIIESLTMVDSDGAHYLTKVAKTLLTEASEVDPAVREAYMVRTID